MSMAPVSEWESSAHARANVGCEACHGDVAAMLLSPKALESHCNAGHGAKKKTARPEYATSLVIGRDQRPRTH